MEFTAMLRYDPRDPFGKMIFGLLAKAGLHVQGIPTVINGNEMQHCYFKASDNYVSLAAVVGTLASITQGHLLGVRIGEE